jgi:hypothetical protein
MSTHREWLVHSLNSDYNGVQYYGRCNGRPIPQNVRIWSFHKMRRSEGLRNLHRRSRGENKCLFTAYHTYTASSGHYSSLRIKRMQVHSLPSLRLCTSCISGSTGRRSQQRPSPSPAQLLGSPSSAIHLA